MNKVYALVFIDPELPKGISDLYFERIDGFNVIEHTLKILKGCDLINTIIFYGSKENFSNPLIKRYTKEDDIKIKFTNKNKKIDKDLSSLFSSGILYVMENRFYNKEDIILFFDPLVFLQDKGDIYRAIDYVERGKKVILGVRSVYHHPCLIFSLGDPCIIDENSPLKKQVAFKDIYYYDYKKSMLIDTKTKKPLLNRQDYTKFYQSLRGLLIFKYKWIEEIIIPFDINRIYAHIIENSFYIENKLDLLKAMIMLNKEERKLKE